MRAVRSGSVQQVHKMLSDEKKRYNINYQDNQGNTAYMLVQKIEADGEIKERVERYIRRR